TDAQDDLAAIGDGVLHHLSALSAGVVVVRADERDAVAAGTIRIDGDQRRLGGYVAQQRRLRFRAHRADDQAIDSLVQQIADDLRGVRAGLPALDSESAICVAIEISAKSVSQRGRNPRSVTGCAAGTVSALGRCGNFYLFRRS